MNLILTIRNILIPLFLSISTLLFVNAAQAACTSPAGNEGDLRYDSGQLKYCLGSNSWRTVTGLVKGGACTSGAIQRSGTELRFCRGATWYHVTTESLGDPGSTGTDAGNTCLVGNQGEFYYDTARDFYVYCDGTDWHDFW